MQIAKESTYVKNINDFYKQITFLKSCNLILAITLIIQSVIVYSQYNKKPIVIYKSNAEVIGYTGSTFKESIDQVDIGYLVKRFIRIRYEWNSFKEKEIKEKLSYILDESLLKKIYKSLEKESKLNHQQKIKQYVGNIQVKITKDKRIIGTFDKILRINNIPLISQSQIEIGIERGKFHELNKVGLYINKVISYDLK